MFLRDTVTQLGVSFQHQRFIQKKQQKEEKFWSFEYFPPKTENGVSNLYGRLGRMKRLDPLFIDVTWGAGGTTADLTLEICDKTQNEFDLETCMHLTCTNMPMEDLEKALKAAKEKGIQNILALRGDPPRGRETWQKCKNGYEYAADLVKFIRATYGDYFCIAVAGYPEGHLECESLEADIAHLKEKIDAGADYIVTQLFYDTNLYIDWVHKVRLAGIHCPILPGIMPIQNYNGFIRMTTLCKTKVPSSILQALETVKDDEEKTKLFGIELATQMCMQILDANIGQGFHFYTLNLENSTREILENLGWVATETKINRLRSVYPRVFRLFSDSHSIFMQFAKKKYEHSALLY